MTLGEERLKKARRVFSDPPGDWFPRVKEDVLHPAYGFGQLLPGLSQVALVDGWIW